MIKPLTLSCILFLFLGLNTFAQETQVSLLEDISYVYIEKLIAVAKENYPRVTYSHSIVYFIVNREESSKYQLI